jgi:hypothetical protein
VVDAVRIAPDVDVDRCGFRPRAAAARDGNVAQRQPQRFIGPFPVARESDALEPRIDGAERALQRHVRERELDGAALDGAALPLEPYGHVATPGLRRDGRRREKLRGDGEIDLVEICRHAPFARKFRAGGGVDDDGLRADFDAARELRRRQRFRLERQHLFVAAQARRDVLECPRDAARSVEIQHAAVTHEHVDVGRHLHGRLLAADRRRSLQTIGAVLVPDERELGAVEREPVDGDLAARREPPAEIEHVETDARAARGQERRLVAGRADAHVAERKLGAAPAPAAFEPRVVERQAELRRDPGLDLVLVGGQLPHEKREPAGAECGEHEDAYESDRRYPCDSAHQRHGRYINTTSNCSGE